VAMNLVRRNAESLAAASASKRTGARDGADWDMDELLLVDLWSIAGSISAYLVVRPQECP